MHYGLRPNATLRVRELGARLVSGTYLFCSRWFLASSVALRLRGRLCRRELAVWLSSGRPYFLLALVSRLRLDPAAPRPVGRWARDELIPRHFAHPILSLMKSNPKRAPYGAKTKARVREMREQGYSVVQITSATGVPASTIARWAAEGKWRVSDLVEEPEFVDPVEAPDGLLPGLGGADWQDVPPSPPFGGSSREEIDPVDRSQARGEGGEVGVSQSRDFDLTPHPSPDQERGSADVQTRQEKLETALEKAVTAAEDAILHGNFAAAGKATQMADTLSRALERVRGSAARPEPEGLFISPEDIEAAREELTRRFDRLGEAMYDAGAAALEQREKTGGGEQQFPRWIYAHCVRWAERVGWTAAILDGSFDESDTAEDAEPPRPTHWKGKEPVMPDWWEQP